MIDYADAYLQVADLSEATLAPEHAADIARWIVENQHYSLLDRLAGCPAREQRLADRHAADLKAPKWADLFGIAPNYTGGMDVDEWLDQQRGEA